MSGVGQMVAPVLARGPETGTAGRAPRSANACRRSCEDQTNPCAPLGVGSSASGTWRKGGRAAGATSSGTARGARRVGEGDAGEKGTKRTRSPWRSWPSGRDEGGRARRVPAPLAPGRCAIRLLRGWRHVRGADPRARPLCDRFLPVPPLARLAWPPSAAAGLASAGAAQRKSWMRVTRRPPRPCFSIACSQVVNSSLERL
jgi:hypothetical protein